MNLIPADTPDDEKIVEFSENPGRRLRVTRQARGIEVERIAAQLHLRVATVEALEQDRYQDLPGPVFVAGYLRNYARLLGLDPEPLIAAYRVTTPAAQAAGLRVSALPGQEIGSGHLLVRLISLGLVAGLVAMLAWWWQNRSEPLPPLTPSDPAGLAPATSAGRPPLGRAPEPARREAAATEARPAPESALSADLSRPLALPSEPPPPAAGTAPATTATPAPAPAAPPAPAEVVLSFSGPTQISVHDATGAALLNGQMRKGDTRTLTGNPPFTFAIGNARAVTLTVGGRSVDLASRARANTARFTFDPSKPE